MMDRTDQEASPAPETMQNAPRPLASDPDPARLIAKGAIFPNRNPEVWLQKTSSRDW